MRVLYFHQHFSTPAGSTGTRSYEQARQLIAAGHRVTMVCGSSKMAKTGLSGPVINGRRTGQVDGIYLIELDLPYSNYDGLLKRSMLFLRYALKSIMLAMTLEYDVLFATTTPLTAGIPGIVSKPFRRKPFVFEVRDLWPELPRAMGVITNPLVLKAMSLLEWLSYHSADACIGLSPGIVEGIKLRGISPDRVHMVPNGCDLELFKPSQNKVINLPGIGRNDFVALFTGAHGLANGLDAVLDAATTLKERGENNIKLVFIGDGKLKPLLMKRAESEGLDNCLFFDPLPKQELCNVVTSAGAGLMVLANVPSFYFGTSPNKFFDYIAAGIPVLNNYPGWLAGLITANDCGIAVPPGDAGAFADALIELRDKPASTAEKGLNARKLSESSFDRNVLAKDFMDVLLSVVNK